MVELGSRTGANGSNGTKASNGRTIDGSPLAHDAEMAWREAQGASQIGPFDYVPPMGFREYWYVHGSGCGDQRRNRRAEPAAAARGW